MCILYVDEMDMTPVKPMRKGRKFDDVLNGARVVFMRDGFEGATVDDIAREAGVSKATLYSYFPDKSHMFLAVLELEFSRHASAIDEHLHQDAPISDVLFAQCRFFVEFLLSDWALEIFRVVTAESGRFPELGRQFYEAGPAAMLRNLAAFLASPKVAADLEIPHGAFGDGFGFSVSACVGPTGSFVYCVQGAYSSETV